MKFTNYKNFMAAATGLVQDGWSLSKFETDQRGVNRLHLHHEELELYYILEHHQLEETYNESQHKAFVRSRGIGTRRYEREQNLITKSPRPLDYTLELKDETIE